jgi:UDP-glucuronate decarboxylase
MLRIVVTGGAGFIGSHLCRRLLDQGHEVIAVDNLSTGSRENVRDLLQRERFELFERDVVEGFADAIHGPINRIYNLACPASPPHYQRDPVHTTLTSVVGVHRCLGLAERSKARLLQASTSEVYGDPELHPQREDYRGSVSSIGPRACYDEGKRCAESLVMDYRRTRGVSVRLARIFNTYGPGMAVDDGRVVSNFIVQALRGDALTIYGDGNQTRSLCYVDDLVSGLIGLMEQSSLPGPVNLGNPEERTVLDLAERVIAAIGRGRIVRRPLPIDDPRRRRPDISLAEKVFGFRPTVPFEIGLGRTICYFQDKLEAGEPRLSAVI